MLVIPRVYRRYNLLFPLERKKIDKCHKYVFNMYNKKNYVVYIKALKLALDYELILDKMKRVTELNQEIWLKPYTDINTELRKKAKTSLKKHSSS